MEKCDLCGKKEEFGNPVYYSEEEFNLCKKDHRKWLRHHKPYREKHKKVKTCTKAWSKMCKEEEGLFKEWLKEQKNQKRR